MRHVCGIVLANIRQRWYKNGGRPMVAPTVHVRFRFVGARIARQGVDIPARCRAESYRQISGEFALNPAGRDVLRTSKPVPYRSREIPICGGAHRASGCRHPRASPFMRNRAHYRIDKYQGGLFVIGGTDKSVPYNIYTTYSHPGNHALTVPYLSFASFPFNHFIIIILCRERRTVRCGF